MTRKVNAHGRTLAQLGINSYLPTGLARKTIDHRQPEPRALADWFGRVEGIKGTRRDLGRHAGPGVGHADREELTWGQIPLAGRTIVEPLVRGLNGKVQDILTNSGAPTGSSSALASN